MNSGRCALPLSRTVRSYGQYSLMENRGRGRVKKEHKVWQRWAGIRSVYAYTQVCTLMKPLSSSGGGADETPVTIDIFTSMLHISYCAQVATQVGKLPGQIMTNGRQISVSSLYKLILACTWRHHFLKSKTKEPLKWGAEIYLVATFSSVACFVGRPAMRQGRNEGEGAGGVHHSLRWPTAF